MKGILILELFGEDTRQLCKIYHKMFEVVGGGDFGMILFDAHCGIPPLSSWVAEVTGPDEKYGLARTFLRGKMDYSKSNSVGSRGVFVEYILSPGKVYEVKSQETWCRASRYFCTVGEEGDIIQLDAETACHNMGALTPEEISERKILQVAEITGPDDQYFFARKFLDCSLRYSETDKLAPYPGYTLQDGKVYEITKLLPRGKRDRQYYLADSGQLIKLDEDEACRAIGALTRTERWEKKHAEKLSGNERPGGGPATYQQGV